MYHQILKRKYTLVKSLMVALGFLPGYLMGQVTISGNIHPSSMYRTSDLSHISLPFRMSEMKVSYSGSHFDVIANGAWENRWRGSEASFDLREAYLAWYPDWGEVKVGKQIIAWGAADGNNPTDNLNAYDYYYLFLPGADRKIGALSGSLSFYGENWQAEAVIVPEHEANRLPFGEKDFPFAPPFEPKDYVSISHSTEYGLRFQTTLGEADWSLSYFQGHDRLFSLLGMELFPGFEPQQGPTLIPKFGYRKTTVIGSDLVTFLGDFTFRVEGAFFRTKNEADQLALVAKQEADYIQYVLQIEYPAPLDITVTGQLIGNRTLKVKGEVFDQATQQLVPLTKDNFVAGMGAPFAMFSRLAALTSASAVFYDDRLEVKANALLNLDEKGSMVGGSIAYSPWLNWKFELALFQISGDKKDPTNTFSILEDFSNIQIGLKYSF